MKTFFPNGIIFLAHLFISLAVLFTFFGCMKNETIREKREYRWATADSGLRIREGPGLDFAQTGTIPLGGEVEIADSGTDLRSVGGKWGRWYRVIYGNWEGYAFGGFLSETPVEVRAPSPEPPPSDRPLQKEVPTPSPPPSPPKRTASVPARPEPKPRTPLDFAYAVHNSPGLSRISLKEFETLKSSITEPFRFGKKDFRNCAGERGEAESIKAYLKRSEASKRAFLERVRKAEYDAAVKTYSIYDAELAVGEYTPSLHRFAYLGTTLKLGSSSEVITLPEDGLHSRGFENGRVQDVKLPDSMVKLLRKSPDSILVRIDFSYAVSLQDIFTWRSRAYFLPRYLMLYNRRTGEVYYECGASPSIKRSDDLAAPLQISSRFLYEKVH